MGLWSIGKIRGRFQPEDFTETQGMETKDQKVFNTVTRVVFAGWNPREVTISFVVDGVHTPGTDQAPVRYSIPRQMTATNLSGQTFVTSEMTMEERELDVQCPIYDPERVWKYIQSLQRPVVSSGKVDPIEVVMPGWGERGGELKYAFITSASIKRTHIMVKGKSRSPIQAVRATITLTLKESVLFGSAEEAKKGGQALVKEK